MCVDTLHKGDDDDDDDDDKEAEYEVKGKNKISCLFSMEDLRIFSRDETELQQELTIVKRFSNDMQMEFGLDICAIAVFKHGKLTRSQIISLNNQIVIRKMSCDVTYKYLGIEEGEGVDSSLMEEKLVKEYYCWVWQILNTDLNLKNKITTVNTVAVPVAVYSFGIVSW